MCDCDPGRCQRKVGPNAAPSSRDTPLYRACAPTCASSGSILNRVRHLEEQRKERWLSFCLRNRFHRHGGTERCHNGILNTAANDKKLASWSLSVRYQCSGTAYSLTNGELKTGSKTTDFSTNVMQRTGNIRSYKSHIAPIPCHTIHDSEQKCVHFCSEWCITAYGTGAFWGLWDWFNEIYGYFLDKSDA